MSGVKPVSPAKAGIPGSLRRLNRDEIVRRGDLVADDQLRLEPWKGPLGFRADAFEKPIYRSNSSRQNAN
jgi:hypothetical protein